MKVAFFDTKSYDKLSFEPLAKKYGVKIKFFDSHLNEDTAPLAKGFDAVCVFVNDNLNKSTIEILVKGGVKLIALRCAGFNNVDTKFAFGKIHVVRVPAYSPYAVAEHAIAMLLTLNRKTHKAYQRTREFNFSLAGLTGFDLKGKTMGVIGTGKIGRELAKIASGFSMEVICYDAYPSGELNFVSLEELFSRSDVISLHCPLTPETTHLINKQSINLMKKGVYIINTSRGALVDAEALLDSIKSGKIGGACLDVYEEESDLFFEDKSDTIIQDDILARLISMPNVLVTSHQAFLTKEALENIAQTTLENIVEFFQNGKTQNEICYKCERLERCRKTREGKCF